MLKYAVIRDSATRRWLRFSQPVRQFVVHELDALREVLASVEQQVDQEQRFAVGYLSYEASPAFDDALRTHAPGELPIACFSIFDAPQEQTSLPRDMGDSDAPQWSLSTSREAYLSSVADVKAQIAAGNTYQVNLTMRQFAQECRDAWSFFCRFAVEAPYATYIDCDDFAVVSASPELFFSLDGEVITCRPMKGTARRRPTLATDKEAADALFRSEKDRAENVMITDMIRNDLGRIAIPGSVETTSLYDIEKYPTVWQMTSTVTARTNSGLDGILEALFPCASVTGAPKAASMGLIADLETSPREVYTGALGYWGPQRQATFSVGIRTASVNKRSGEASYGVGSGIVWDSVPADEYAECLAKARVLARSEGDRQFQLLETLFWSPADSYTLLDEHMERLASSARYFGFACDPAAVTDRLRTATARFPKRGQRVRLLVDASGDIGIENSDLSASLSRPMRVRLAAQAVSADDTFLYHKTTRRKVYDDALAAVADCDDVLLWNEDGFVTETTIANVLVQVGDTWITPPVSCGLLAGTCRTHLLKRGEIEERLIHKDDLVTGQSFTLINAVRGRFDAALV